MSATGRSLVRNGLDFYETPAWCVRAILKHLPLGGRILEPGCGNGAILKALLAADLDAHAIVGVEQNPELADLARAALPGGEVHCEDFLTCDDYGGFDLVIGNPPYGLAQEFVERALQLAEPDNGTVAMLLRLSWVASLKRVAFHKAAPCDIYVLPRRPSFTGGGTDSCDYAWFTWAPGGGGRWRVLDLGGPV
jgi:predicted RNA methylase